MNIETVITIIIQFAGFAYLFGTLTTRVKHLEEDVSNMAQSIQMLTQEISSSKPCNNRRSKK